MMYFLRSIASRTVGSLLDRSTRRRATVTISAPLAARAARVSSRDAYLPVPTMMREVSSRFASFQVSVNISASTDEGHELELVAGGQHRRRMLRARYDFSVSLDRDTTIGKSQHVDESCDGGAVWDDTVLTVDDDLNGLRHRGGNYHARCQ